MMRCSRSHTPVSCQARLRQAVCPEPHPSSGGRSRHRQPVRSTNRMPSSAARSSIRGRPPGPRGRGRAGSSGQISSQSRSSTSRRCLGVTTGEVREHRRGRRRGPRPVGCLQLGVQPPPRYSPSCLGLASTGGLVLSPNVSAIYLGTAIGGLVGGIVIDAGDLLVLPVVSAGFSLVVIRCYSDASAQPQARGGGERSCHAGCDGPAFRCRVRWTRTLARSR
jgi:hypothetical protein